jgi:hypothetical protein
MKSSKRMNKEKKTEQMNFSDNFTWFNIQEVWGREEDRKTSGQNFPKFVERQKFTEWRCKLTPIRINLKTLTLKHFIAQLLSWTKFGSSS